MGTGYIGFKNVVEEERPRLAQALREAHFSVEVVGEYVMVQTDDIVPVVEIYGRTCKSKARVLSVHLTDEELAEVENGYRPTYVSRKASRIFTP